MYYRKCGLDVVFNLNTNGALTVGIKNAVDILTTLAAQSGHTSVEFMESIEVRNVINGYVSTEMIISVWDGDEKLYEYVVQAGTNCSIAAYGTKEDSLEFIRDCEGDILYSYHSNKRYANEFFGIDTWIAGDLSAIEKYRYARD